MASLHTSHSEHNSETFLWTTTMPCVAWPLLTFPTLSPNTLPLALATPATPAAGQVHFHLIAFAHSVPTTACLSPSSAHGGSSSPRPNSASTVYFSLPSATPLPSLSKELLSTCCYVVVFTVIPFIFPVALRGSWGTSECSNSKSPTPTQENPS